MTNGSVDAVAQSGGTLFLGGSFSQVGPRTGSFVGVSSASGQASAPYPQVTGTVDAMVGDGSGGYFIGGSFTAVEGTAINNAAHIRADGTLDTGWNPNPDNTVSALTVSGTTVYLGGGFTHVTNSTGAGTVTRNFAAAVDATNGRDTGWNPNPDSPVSGLAVSGTTVYLGGSFTHVTNSTGTTTVTRNHAAAVDTTNGYDTGWNPNPDGFVSALAVSVSGTTVYLGGSFTHVTDSTGTTTVTRNHAAAVDATNGRDTGWNPNPDNFVDAMAVSGTTVYLGGSFTQVTDSTGTSTVTRNHAAAVDATNGHDTGWNPNPDGFVSALAVSGSTVYLGGNFTQVTDSTGTSTVTRNHAAAVDTTNGRDTGWNPNPNNTVSALAVSGSTVYLGGTFTSVNGVARSNAAALDSAGTVTGWNPNPDNIVLALAVSGSTVYLGGKFSQVTDSTGAGTVTRNHAAAVDATNGRDTGWDPNPNSPVDALAVSGSTVYLGGSFSQVNGVARANAAALDSAGTVTGWNPNPNSTVDAMAVSGSTVYLGGNFTQVTNSTGTSTVARKNAAAVDTTNGRDTGWKPNPTSYVLALAVSGSTVYLGGGFSQVTDSTGAGTVTRNFAAAVDATHGRDTGWNPNPDSPVDAMAVSGSTVYLGGGFTQVTDSTGTTTVTRNHAAAVDATNGHDTGWNPNPDNPVDAMAVSGSTLYLGGNFNAVGLLPQSDIAEFSLPPSPIATFSAAQSPGSLNVKFTDTSTAVSPATVTGWSWDFGDGGNSTMQNPSHTYSTAGNYTVKLTVTDSNGHTSQVSHQVSVTALAPAVSITAPADHASYLQGQGVNASYNCQEGAGGPGLNSTGGCVGTAPSGSPLSTSTPGAHAFTVTATSKDGQSTSKTVHYTVTAAATKRARARLHLIRITNRGPQRGCKSELNQASAAAVSPARCNHGGVSFAGTVNQKANGQTITITLTARISGRTLTVHGHAHINHGHYQLAVNLPGRQTDRRSMHPINGGDRWNYRITYPGNSFLRPALITGHLTFEVEPPNSA